METPRGRWARAEREKGGGERKWCLSPHGLEGMVVMGL